MLALFPEILHKVAAGDLETLACLVRKYFADKQIYSPRLRVEPLLINAGLELSRDDIGAAARLFAADHRGAWHASIILSPNLRDPAEVNFTLAHLYGRFLFEIQPRMAKGELKSEEVIERTGSLGRFLKKPDSAALVQRADAFANALLMPCGMVKKAYATLGTADDTAAFFNVRPELMQKRLAQLDLLPKPAPIAQPPHEPAPLARTAAPAQAAPAAPAAPRPPQNSLMKAQKAATASLYRREESSQTTQAPEQKSSDGLSRLRAIARKIDKSVDP